MLENLSYHYEIASWEVKQKLLKILFPDKLITFSTVMTTWYYDKLAGSLKSALIKKAPF